jgi:hypothetical protein
MAARRRSTSSLENTSGMRRGMRGVSTFSAGLARMRASRSRKAKKARRALSDLAVVLRLAPSSWRSTRYWIRSALPNSASGRPRALAYSASRRASRA